MRNKCAVFFVLLLLALCGCQSHEISFDAKKHSDVDFVRRAYVGGRSVVFQELGTNLLRVLSSATVKTLKKPQFASAAMGIDQDGEYRLIVFWLENTPRVNGVQLRLGRRNSPEVFGVPDFDRKENAGSKKASLMMSAMWVWPRTADIWTTFEQIQDVSAIKVRLLISGAPVSEWHPVSFYYLDHWMGSKAIKRVRTGSIQSIIQDK